MSITDAERISKLVEKLSKGVNDLRNDMNHRFGELRNDMNNRFEDTNHRIAIVQWEVRVWFPVLMALITILTFLKP
jgi:hypothetical protein